MSTPELSALLVIAPAMAFIFGLIWGSFFNVCIFRIPADQSVVIHSSRCPKCAAPILWHHNIPLLGFLILQGRCYRCKQKISIQYPIVEIISGLMFYWLFQKFGLTWSFLGAVVLCSLLLIISVIDLHHRIIPDELSLSGIVVGFVFALIIGRPLWWDSLLGILVGGGIFFSIAWAYEKFAGREGLGGGDIKLLAMLGAWQGAGSILMIVIISSALGSIVGISVMLFEKKGLKTAIPFGPFLAAAALIQLQWGDVLRDFFFFHPGMP